MKKLTLLLLAGFALASCSDDNENKAEETIPDTTIAVSNPATLEVNYNNPTLIDSSDYVIYTLDNPRLKTEESRLFISKSKEESRTYWNIIFYNTVTKQSRLLSTAKKMVILSFDQNKYKSYGSDVILPQSDVKHKGYILYSVITSDYNKDGVLDYNDPSYLFISDAEGNNFKQISPDNEEVLNWQTVEKSGKLLFNTLTDKNNDKVFDHNDITASYAYDLKTGNKAEEVFTPQFNKAVNQLYEAQWPKPKKK